MAIVTGILADFGLALLSPYSPRIIFTASSNAVFAADLLATRPLVCLPSTIDGTFSIDIANTDAMRPETWYTIRIEWLDTAGNYVGADFPTWRLYVPLAGGRLADLIAAPWNPAMVWADPLPPTGTPTANTFWLNTTTGDLARWAA